MPLKKTVAMERRIDLASLFCLIARHGPAVLMALAVFGCLAAGVVIFKKMREKRRMGRAAKRRDSNAGERDAALGPEEEEEDPGRTTRSGSTDASDDVKEHTYLSYGQVRQRRTPSERKPYKHKVPGRDTAIDNTQHAFFWEWDAHRTLSYAEEEPVLNLEKCHTHKSEEDVAQEVHGAKEPELIKEEEEQKMPEADSIEDLSSSNEDVSEREFRPEETVPFNFNSQSCSCPTPNLSVDDRKENTKESNLKHLESELEDGTAPVLVKENIISGPHKEDKNYQENNTTEQNLECGESGCLNNERQAERPCNDSIATSAATSSVEIKVDSSPVTSQKEETEPPNVEETKDESVLLSSIVVNFKPSDTSGITESYQDREQSHTQIDQNGCCPQEQSHHIAEVQTDKDLSTSQKDTEMVNTGNKTPIIITGESINISITDAITHCLDVNMAEEDVVHQETFKNLETETAGLSENTCLQNQQSHDIASQVLDGNQAYTDNSSDQKDITEELKTAASCTETDANVVDCTDIQSVDSRQVECLAHPQPNQFAEVLDEETSQSGLPADVKAEILSITDIATSSNGTKENGMIHSLNTETTIPPGLDNDSKQAAKAANTNTDAIEISPAMINDKIDCIVEQIVAEAYEEVRQSSLEAKSAQLEEKTLEQPSLVQQTQESFGVDNENVASNAMENDMGNVFKKESKEVAFCSNMAAQITEEVVNTVCSLELSNLNAEHERQKDIVSSVASDSFSQIHIDSNDMPVVKTVIQSQEINKDEEEKTGQETLKMEENEISVQIDTNLIQPAAIEVKSLQMDKNISLEQMVVQSLPDNESTDFDKLSKDPIVKATEQEKKGDLSSNMDTQIQSEKTNAASYQEVNNLANVEGESLSGITMETVENLETSMEKSQQKAPEMLADINNGLSKTESEVGKLLLTKDEDQPEIQPVKTEILQITATSNEVEMKEPGMSSDANNDVPSSIGKGGCKVVIVCRTLEANVSAVEMFDCEDIDGKTSHLELTSSGSFPCQDYFGDKAAPAHEEFSTDVAASCDTLAEETATQETCKNSDLTSGSALDFSQDNGTAVKSMQQIGLKDYGVSSPSLESGISSMTVTPEMEEADKEIGQIVVCDLPADFDPMLSSQNTSCSVFHAEERVSHSLSTTSGVVTVVEEDVVSTHIEPLASSPVQLPAPDGLSNEVSVTNEDSFGSAIEERYQKAMEEVMMDVVHNSKCISDDMTKEEVKKVDEKKEQACDTNKEEGEKADSEKTDISIMEATMDHNEWIIDGSYQVLPWMNATTSKDATSSKQGVDLVENKPSPQASTTDDSTENAKKVLAVQPMPQNVNVTFRVHYVPLSPYQTVAVTGDQQELGAWKSVVPLEKTKDGYWSCVVGLPAESHVEWKFVVLDKGEVCRWEECGNRVLYTGYGDDLLVHKWWGFL